MAKLSYPDDRALVGHVAALPRVTAVTALVRHANAGERKQWKGNDNLRPLDEQGVRQAEEIAAVVELFEPKRLWTATPLRCKQTLQPLADKLGLPIVNDSAFSEPADTDDVPAKVKLALSRLTDLRSGGTAAVCSQGKMIPPLLAALEGAADDEPYKTAKGSGWLLTWGGRPPARPDPALTPLRRTGGPGNGSARQYPTRSPVSQRARHISSPRGSQSRYGSDAARQDSTQARYQPHSGTSPCHASRRRYDVCGASTTTAPADQPQVISQSSVFQPVQSSLRSPRIQPGTIAPAKSTAASTDLRTSPRGLCCMPGP